MELLFSGGKKNPIFTENMSIIENTLLDQQYDSLLCLPDIFIP